MDGLIDSPSFYARYIRRSLQDGLTEIQVGLFGMLMASGFCVPYHKWPIEPFLVIWSVALSRLAFKKIREIYVIPRTGYVVFRRSESELWKDTWILSGALVAATVLLLVSIVYFPSVWNVSGPIAALVAAGGLVWCGRFFRFPHLHWLAGFAVALGATAQIAGANGFGVLWEMLGVSAALVVSGALRFGMFLKTHPVMQEPQ